MFFGTGSDAPFEREFSIENEKERKSEQEGNSVCVCVKERERERGLDRRGGRKGR